MTSVKAALLDVKRKDFLHRYVVNDERNCAGFPVQVHSHIDIKRLLANREVEMIRRREMKKFNALDIHRDRKKPPKKKQNKKKQKKQNKKTRTKTKKVDDNDNRNNINNNISSKDNDVHIRTDIPSKKIKMFPPENRHQLWNGAVLNELGYRRQIGRIC